MKIKMLIAVALCLSSFAFIFLNEFNKVKIENIPVSAAEKKLTPEEQQNHLEYFLSARSFKLECETSYGNIGTGKVIEDSSEYGNGIQVIHCSAGLDNAGYIKGAKIPGAGDIITKYSNDTLHTFYIRPRMRIKRELIYPMKENYNDQNLNTQICRLEIVNAEGKIVREVEFIARDFMEKNPDDEGSMYYSGNYHEGAGGFLNRDSLIVIDGKDINPAGISPDSKTKLDFRIYWYGYTDVWLDYIEVNNNVARDLLTGRYDNWLNAMDNVSANIIEQIKSTSYTGNCNNYIYEKIINNKYSLR